MPYQIVRTVEYKDRADLKYPFSYLQSVNFYSEVQPYYPDLTLEVFNEEINSYRALMGDIQTMNIFFNNTSGLFSYSYQYINPNDRLDGVIQTIVYNDKDAYDQWQSVENSRGMATVGQLTFNLGENGSFDASNFVLNGITKTDTSTGITKDLSFGPYLMTKFNMLRKTICTNVHSIIE